MIASDFRRIALSSKRGGRLSHGPGRFPRGRAHFATLASEKLGFGNLMLTQSSKPRLSRSSRIFSSHCRRLGQEWRTHIRLAEADENLLAGALRTAWQLRIEKNQKSRSKPNGSARLRNEGANDPAQRSSQDTKGRVRARLISRRLRERKEAVWPERLIALCENYF